jgi:hypothetical protein
MAPYSLCSAIYNIGCQLGLEFPVAVRNGWNKAHTLNRMSQLFTEAADRVSVKSWLVLAKLTSQIARSIAAEDQGNCQDPSCLEMHARTHTHTPTVIIQLKASYGLCLGHYLDESLKHVSQRQEGDENIVLVWGYDFLWHARQAWGREAVVRQVQNHLFPNY